MCNRQGKTAIQAVEVLGLIIVKEQFKMGKVFIVKGNLFVECRIVTMMFMKSTLYLVLIHTIRIQSQTLI